VDRKEIIRKYKETPLPAGVFRVRNTVNKKSFVSSAPNLTGKINSQRFQLEIGSHRNQKLQKDWNEFGPDAFTFEILDQLEPKDEPDYNPAEDLRILLEMWLEKLASLGETFY